MTKNSIVSGAVAITAVCISVAIDPVCRADDGEKARALLEAVDLAISKDRARLGGEEGRQKRAKLEKMLLEVDPQSMDHDMQSLAVNGLASFIEDKIFRSWHSFMPQEAWNIRLAALVWERDYLSRYAAAMPDHSAESRKTSSSPPVDLQYTRFVWRQCVDRANSFYRQRVTAAYADTELEWTNYSDEFRAWCRSGIEKAIGRPLTDADFGAYSYSVNIARQERKMIKHDAEVRKPYDGGDVLPHPFTFFGCVLGSHYELSKPISKHTHGDETLYWYRNFAIEPYFGKVRMLLSLAPRSKIAFSAKISWFEFDGLKTREDVRARAKDIKSDIEKRLGVKLGEFFFESGQHVCDEVTWWKADGATARSRSKFGLIMIEIEAIDDPTRCQPRKQIVLTITDTAAEALVEKERKENPLTYDSKAEKEAERRRFERLKELGRQRKAMKDAQKAGGAEKQRGVR